ncbi:unnamed protein product, partial [Pylaiella littoralis]
APFKSVPSHTTVREYLRICSVISTEALKALRSMEEQGLQVVERITKTFLLKDKEFSSLRERPQQQSLYLQIYARYPKNKEGVIDLQAVTKQAKAVAAWRAGVELVVPRNVWSTKMVEMVDNYAFAHIGDYAHYLKPHLARIDSDVKKLEDGLPAHK